MLAFLNVNGQHMQKINDKIESKNFIEGTTYTFLEPIEDLFQVNIVTLNYNQFSGVFNLRIEDELTSEDNYILLKEITFFDVQLNYKLGPILLFLNVNNLLGFNDNSFAIEPELEQGIGVVNNLIFSQESNFGIHTGIRYTF